MLGRLNKWLRVLGYDAICRRILDQDLVPPHFKDGRILLTRHRKRAQRFDRVLLLHEDHVGDQLAELRNKLGIDPDRSQWFSRCLVCNTILIKAPEETSKENVPDHVYPENIFNDTLLSVLRPLLLAGDSQKPDGETVRGMGVLKWLKDITFEGELS